MTPRLALSIAALLMAVAVACGAFGAHALKSRLAPDALAVWQTAVNYHAWHAIALLATAMLMLHMPGARALAWAAGLFLAGITLFSGSLYALALGASPKVGMITPYGGAAFIAGWITLAIATLGSATVSEVKPTE